VTSPFARLVPPPRFVQRTAEYKAYVEAGSKAEALDQLELALRKAFLEIDEAMRNEPDAVNGNDRSGCTALVAFITPHAVVIAHAGDSRGILRRSGGVVLATEDHKPYNDEERRRIEAAGGSVSMKRVDGDLAVSRALGDFQYKEEKYPPEDRKVTALPEVKRYERTKNDELLVLCCDGIWDVMSNEECARELGSIFDEGEGSLGVACEELLDMCLHKGSRDNMSAVIVAFPALKYGSGEGVAGRRKQRAAEQAGDSQDDLGEQNTGEFSS
jgi:protein phosphatase 1B